MEQWLPLAKFFPDLFFIGTDSGGEAYAAPDFWSGWRCIQGPIHSTPERCNDDCGFD